MTLALTIRWSSGERTASPGETVTFGRDPSNDVVLDNPAVSRRHAHVAHDGARWVLTDDASTQGVFVDGARVPRVSVDRPVTVVLGQGAQAERIVLTPLSNDAATVLPGLGDTVLPGTADTVLPGGMDGRPGGALREPGPAAGTVVAGSSLTVECGGQTITVGPNETVTIGRDATCTIVSANPTVSREHAAVRFDGTSWLFEDRSRRGSFLDDARVSTVTLAGATALMLGDPQAGERVVLMASGERQLTTGQRVHRVARSGRALVAVGVVAALAVGVGVFAVARSGSSSASSSNDDLARATVHLFADFGDVSVQGSGTIIDASRGLILTNAHVAAPSAPGRGLVSTTPEGGLSANPRDVVVAVSPGLDRAAEPRFRAELVAADGYADLAVIRITKSLSGALVAPADLRGLHQATVGNSDTIRTGDEVRVIGYPAVASASAVTITKGVIASPVADERMATNRAWLNVDAAINAGNSGGLAADRSGRIVGVPSISRTQTGDNPSNINRIDAIRPINLARDLIAAARAKTDYVSPYVTLLSGDEVVSDYKLVKPGPVGVATTCSTAAAAPTVGATELAVSFTYAGFPVAHQDLLVTVADPTGKLVGLAEASDQWPLAWKSKGCATVSIKLVRALAAGKYSLVVYLGPNYKVLDKLALPVA